MRMFTCFWVYRDVGRYITQRADLSSNLYERWIAMYSSEDFKTVVEEAIHIMEYTRILDHRTYTRAHVTSVLS